MKPRSKLTTSQIVYAFLNGPEKLRTHGYTPKRLLESAKESFHDNQKIRARVQLRTMKRFEPTESETPLFEESGNELFLHNYNKQAAEHWTVAYDHGHKPYDMSMLLGHYTLVNGQLNKSQSIFNDLALNFPTDSIVFNELGVAHFMVATQHKDPEKFSFYRYLAIHSFDASFANQPNAISDQNKKVATCLTYTPHYGLPYLFLKTRSDAPTRLIQEQEEASSSLSLSNKR